MDPHIFNKSSDTNIGFTVYATLIDIYDGAEISMHEDRTWAYKFQVPYWYGRSETDIMLARGEYELEINTMYMLTGSLSINEGEGWTRTAFEVDTAFPWTPLITTAAPWPQFHMDGLVLEAKDGKLVLGWERYDEDLENFAWVYASLWYENAAEDMLYKNYSVEGHMDGPDRMRDWVVTHAAPAA